MQIILTPVELNQLWESWENDFLEMMKIVVDVREKILAIDGDMYADLEQLMLQNGSLQQDL